MAFLPILTRAAALASCAGPVGALAADEAPLRMSPSSGWVMDYADTSCALRRAFVAGDHTAILELRQYGPGPRIEILVVSETLAQKRDAPRVRFEPDEEWFEPMTPFFVESGNRRGIIYDHSLRPENSRPQDEPLPPWLDQDRDAREQAITGLTIGESFEQDVTLDTGNLHRPMEAMRACINDLVAGWGIDSGVPGPLARGATPLGIAEWSRRAFEVYPTDMIRAGKSARVPVRLVVGKNGRPTSCHPAGFAEPSFLDAACSGLMRHARFNPAVDGNGEPIVGTYVTTMVYQLH